jgi:hypothetical protein
MQCRDIGKRHYIHEFNVTPSRVISLPTCATEVVVAPCGSVCMPESAACAFSTCGAKSQRFHIRESCRQQR